MSTKITVNNNGSLKIEGDFTQVNDDDISIRMLNILLDNQIHI